MEKKKVSKINEFNILGIMIQGILTIACLVLVIINFIVKKNLFPVIDIIIGLDLMIMAYNNYKVYKKKNLTILYLIVGFVLLLVGILLVVGVI